MLFTNATHHTDLYVCKNNCILSVTFLVSYVLITLSHEPWPQCKFPCELNKDINYYFIMLLLINHFLLFVD